MIRLHDNLSSGNGYKARLLLAQLGVPFERVEYDIDRAETRTPEFLSMNPNGRVPVLELEDGPLPPRVERHPLLPRRGHAVPPRGPLRKGAGPALGVLRAVLPRAEHRLAQVLDHP